MGSAGTGSGFVGNRGEFSSAAGGQRLKRVCGRLVLTVAVSLFLSAFLAACSGFFFSSNSLSSTFINPAGPTIAISDTVQLVVHGMYTDGSQNEIGGGSVSWSSSDPTIATVTSPGGLVTGVAVGTATITSTTTATIPGSGCQTVVSVGPPLQIQQVCHPASTETLTATANVSVTASNVNRAVITTTPASTVFQATATISGAPATLQFYAYADGDASNDVTQAVTWTSSNKSVATISSGLSSGNGLATSVAAGTTNITASTTTNTGQVINSQTILLTVR